MAHIADFMVNTSSSAGLNNYIGREMLPHPPQHAVGSDTTSSAEEKEKFIWRMHQPTEPRKYHIFPGPEKLSLPGKKNPDVETTLMASGQPSLAGNALRKPKEQTLVRRRKISVPELGPMTTVQEIAMDSPTIPGRPPLHERSISAPGNTWRQHMFGESMLSCIAGPALDELAELAIASGDITTTSSQPNNSNDNLPAQIKSRPNSPKQPVSPKSLAPLVIPTTKQRIVHHSSNSRLRNDFPRPDVPPKSGPPRENTPYPRSSPYTPISSASSVPVSTPYTPYSAQSAPEGRSSPRPWAYSTSQSPSGHPRGQSESQRRTPSQSPNPTEHSRTRSDTPAPLTQLASTQQIGHRRGESEGSSSVMDRGRPKKRSDTSRSLPKQSTSNRSASTEEQRAFEYIPSGVRAIRANGILSPTEIDTLRAQAMGQASRFDVLSSKDVESLSRELRGLDERCEYLRKTHRSLRSGRRNLHDRICSYLRSPRVARFSHESLLKQEEALSELDSSIDDWVTKLEQAENRRTRIRQKLLEHVAAAVTMQPSATKPVAIPPNGQNTPPRSPTKKEATSPAREVERVVSEVRVASPEKLSRQGTIRIYADSDVYALLADVESEITRMGELDAKDAQEKQEKDVPQQEKEKKEIVAPQDTWITLSATTFEGLPARTYTPPVPQRV